MQVDQDGSLRGDFRELLDRFGMEILVTRDGHWSHGVVERKILTVKEIITRWPMTVRSEVQFSPELVWRCVCRPSTGCPTTKDSHPLSVS